MPKRHYEDGPGWNPRTMGNRRSGPPVAGPAGSIGSHRDLIIAWLAAHDRPRVGPQSVVPRKPIPLAPYRPRRRTS